MAQYGNKSKNPPWARGDQSGLGLAQNQMQQQLMNANLTAALPNAAMLQYPQQQMFQGQMNFQQQMYGNMGTVQYPTRALNSAAFQNTAQPPFQSSLNRSNEQNKDKVITGTVTKLEDNFGFVDDDIFFQTSCVTNGANNLRIGSRVLVEAIFNPTMPFKWNAQRIQVLPNSSQPQQQQRGNYNAVPPPSDNSGGGDRYGGNRFGGGNRNQQQNKNKSMQHQPQQNRRPNRERSASVESDRKRRKPERRRTPSRDRRSKSRSRSPARKKRRPYVPRYNVQLPKFSLINYENDVMDLKRKFNSLYIPSDFFLSRSSWVNCFPLDKPFNLDCPCKFHIFHKEAIPLQKTIPEPSDVDYLFCAKVILLASPGLEELYKKCITLAEDSSRSDSRSPDDDLTLPSRLIQVLVGQRGKEPMAIGGPWSPSLDGADPSSDPGVLIKTAIRSTKYQTGIDLSNCTHWLRFLEIHYHRGESVHKGKTIPARVETVVLFIPDVWSCVPTRPEWDQLSEAYTKQMNRQLTKATDPEADEKNENEDGDDKDDDDDDAVETIKKEPTHYSDLDPKNMKVSDLRDELEARNLSPKGLKTQLVARLSKAIKSEADAEEQKEEEDKDKGLSDDELDYDEKMDDDKEENEKEKEKEKEKEEKKEIDEKERALFEKRYKLPETPQILVHPNPEIKSGKFNCVTASLYSLLNYRIEDNKEHSFEMFLFAEMFNAMLMRDFGFTIYRSLCVAAAKAKEEMKEKEKEDKDKEKKSKDIKDKDDKKSDKDKKNDDDKKEKDGDEEKDDDKESTQSKDKKEEKKDDKKKEKTKLKTTDPFLLLAFAYFDNTHCGYIVERDLEDILSGLSLSLSRAQAKKLLLRVVTKDSLHYRKLTDQSVEEEEEMEDSKQDSIDAKVILSTSNRELLPKFDSEKAASAQAEKLDSGFVTYNGSLIDVGKLMGQLERNEASRLNTEKLYNKLVEENDNLKKNYDESTKNVKDLTFELNTFKKRLSTSNNDLDCMSAKVMRYVDVIFRIKNQIDPIVKENTPDEEEDVKPLPKVKLEQLDSSKSKSGKETPDVELVEVKSEKKLKDTDNKEAQEKPKSPEKKEVQEKLKETDERVDKPTEEVKENDEKKDEPNSSQNSEVMEVGDDPSNDTEEKENGEKDNDENEDKKSEKSIEMNDENKGKSKLETRRKVGVKEESERRTPRRDLKKDAVATPTTPKRKTRQ